MCGVEPPEQTTHPRQSSALERISCELQDYLDTKRMAFPRFYFLSRDELLRMLGRGRTPSALEDQMAACFAGIDGA